MDAEKGIGRKGENVSAVVGYAGGPKKGAEHDHFICLLLYPN